jgi:hypothetical protein
MKPSDTPRSDAHVESRFTTWDTRTADADFARELERELAAEREHADRLAAALYREMVSGSYSDMKEADAILAEHDARRKGTL